MQTEAFDPEKGNPNAPAPGDTFIQPKITGYRQLTPEEAALMNEAKAIGAVTENLVKRLIAYHLAQREQAFGLENSPVELDRIRDAEPARWLAMGRTDIQTGIMKIVRSIAQPAS